MLRLIIPRLMCFCLAALVAVLLALPITGAAEPACHQGDVTACLASDTAPCPPDDAGCRATVCPSHAVALTAPPQGIPPALDITARLEWGDGSALRPLRHIRDLLRPPKA